MSKSAPRKPPPAEEIEQRRALLEHFLLDIRGFKDVKQATDLAGVNHQYFSRWLPSKGGNVEAQRKVAEAVGLSPTQLDTFRSAPLGEVRGFVERLESGVEIAAVAPARGRLPLRYTAQAGSWHDRDEFPQTVVYTSAPLVADPDYPRSAQFAVMVRGDSVDRAYPDGAVLLAVDADQIGYGPESVRTGHFVILERTRHQGGLLEYSVKRAERKGDKPLFWPYSHNKAWAGPISLDVTEDDDAVRIAGLVLGGYVPTRV